MVKADRPCVTTWKLCCDRGHNGCALGTHDKQCEDAILELCRDRVCPTSCHDREFSIAIENVRPRVATGPGD